MLQIFFQCAAGKLVNASRSSAASRSMVSTLTDCRPSIPAITPSCSRTCAASGWAKMVRIAAATISALPLGTWAKTLRRKCNLRGSPQPRTVMVWFRIGDLACQPDFADRATSTESSDVTVLGGRDRVVRVGGVGLDVVAAARTWRPTRRLLPPFARRGSAIRPHALAARGAPCFVVSSKIRGPIACLRWLTGTRIGDSRRHSCSVRICPDAQWWLPRSGTAAGTRGRGEP